MLDVLALLSSDCELRNKLGNQGCGALYPALGVPLDGAIWCSTE